MPQLVSWHPPRQDFVALNTNGNVSREECKAGTGGLIREGSSNWLLGFSGRVYHNASRT